MKHPPSVKNLKAIKFLDKVPFFESDTFFERNGTDINRMIKKEKVFSKNYDNYIRIDIRNIKSNLISEDMSTIKYKDLLSLSEYCFDRVLYLSPDKTEVYGMQLGIDSEYLTTWITVDFGLLFGEYSIPKSKNLMSTMYPKYQILRDGDDYITDRDKILDTDIPLRIYGLKFGGMKVYLEDDPTKPVFLASLRELD